MRPAYLMFKEQVSGDPYAAWHSGLPGEICIISSSNKYNKLIAVLDKVCIRAC